MWSNHLKKELKFNLNDIKYFDELQLSYIHQVGIDISKNNRVIDH